MVLPCLTQWYHRYILISPLYVLDLEMARSDQQVNFRMPHELVEELKTYAKQERRSVTAQLNAIVESWVNSQKAKEGAKA